MSHPSPPSRTLLIVCLHLGSSALSELLLLLLRLGLQVPLGAAGAAVSPTF